MVMMPTGSIGYRGEDFGTRTSLPLALTLTQTLTLPLTLTLTRYADMRSFGCAARPGALMLADDCDFGAPCDL